MAQSAFAIHLGKGVYLDADGNIYQGTPYDPAKPVYEAPFKLPIDPNKAKDALKQVQDALKDINKNASVLKKFEELGLDTGVLDMLSGVAKVAGIIAPALAAIAILYDLAKFFGLFGSAPSEYDRLENVINARFDALEDKLEAFEAELHLEDLRDQRVIIEGFVDHVKTFVKNVTKPTNYDIAQLKQDYDDLIELEVQGARNAVGNLLDASTWMATPDINGHTRVWPWLKHLLHSLPNAAGEARKPQSFPPSSLVFDHRFMVPLACFAAETYLTCIRGILPEHRSQGTFSETLARLSVKMDNIAQKMRDECLALTVYKKEHFAFPVMIAPQDVVPTGTFPFVEHKISPSCSRFPVGAMDLRYHDDQFFGKFLDDLWKAEFFGYPHPTRRGGMDFRWIPPAKLETASFGNFQISNPEECAAAANAQAEQDYADLLSVSGYTELIRLAALLRNESTEPDRSQTVTTEKPSLYRDPLPEIATTVQSDPIFMTGVITSPATREPQKFMATLNLRTQSVKRSWPTQYKIKLRTLRSISANKRYREPRYSDYYEPRYEGDFAREQQFQDQLNLNPGLGQNETKNRARFLKMKPFKSDLALEEVLLAEGSNPGGDPVHYEDVAKMKAHTFDWWIPVKPPFQLETKFNQTMLELQAFGWAGQGTGTGGMPPILMPTLVTPPMPSPPPPSGSSGPLITAAEFGMSYSDLIPLIAWKSGEQEWDGQHREPKEEQISLEYELEWAGDHLGIILKNDPADRNYVVYLVVEEEFGSGEIMHTAVPIPIHGQLTYVPQKFFDDEAEAIAKAAKTITEFERRYSISEEPGPLDPVVGWLRPADLVSQDSIARFAALAEQHAPELLREVMAANGADQLGGETMKREQLLSQA